MKEKVNSMESVTGNPIIAFFNGNAITSGKCSGRGGGSGFCGDTGKGVGGGLGTGYGDIDGMGSGAGIPKGNCFHPGISKC